MSRPTGGCVMPLDTSMTLPDGRTLAYTDCGDCGAPVGEVPRLCAGLLAASEEVRT